MKKHPALPGGPTARISALVFTAFVLTITACDPGKLSTCAFIEQVECRTPSMPDAGGSSVNTDSGIPPRPPTVSIARVFNEVARIRLDPSLQFAGLYQNEAVIKDGARNLLRITRRTDIPTIAYTSVVMTLKIYFFTDFQDQFDKIYFTGLSPYFIQYDPRITNVYNSDSAIVWTSGTSDRGPSVRAFFDSQTSSYAVSALSNDTTYVHAHIIGTNLTHSVTSRKISANVIGDLDKYDDTNNGLELIVITGDGIDTLKHHKLNSNNNTDKDLASALSNSLIHPTAGLSVTSACIIDINNDGLMDFLYAIGGTMQAATYLGRSWIASGQSFYSWPPGTLPTITTPEILSIHPINIDGDLFPDIVIETRDSLIYFLNKPAT